MRLSSALTQLLLRLKQSPLRALPGQIWAPRATPEASWSKQAGGPAARRAPSCARVAEAPNLPTPNPDAGLPMPSPATYLCARLGSALVALPTAGLARLLRREMPVPLKARGAQNWLAVCLLPLLLRRHDRLVAGGAEFAWVGDDVLLRQEGGRPRALALLALIPAPAVHTYAGATAQGAFVPLAPVLADADAAALLTPAPLPAVWAEVRTAAKLAPTFPPPVLADGAPTAKRTPMTLPAVLADGAPTALLAPAAPPAVLTDHPARDLFGDLDLDHRFDHRTGGLLRTQSSSLSLWAQSCVGVAVGAAQRIFINQTGSMLSNC